jgi:hypothetical protein
LHELTPVPAKEARSCSGLFFVPGSIRGNKINSGLIPVIFPDIPAALAAHCDGE